MTGEKPTGDRIAKVLARAGIASRREAEKMIEAGRVSVNGKKIDSPALNIGPRDKVAVDGAPLAAAEPTRMWLYYKPLGLVTTDRDEKGRETVFDTLPEDMPRVMSVGRLDLNSEGLLLLTNDGELKRRLELPSTGWLRKYRVRVNGAPTDAMLEPLRAGITVEGERFQGMVVTLDRQQGANAWLTIGLREGKNREIRRALESVGLQVNRLIRLSYGPFKLNEMQPGEVQEVRAKVLRDQLGTGPAPEPEATTGRAQRKPGLKPRPARNPGKAGADAGGREAGAMQKPLGGRPGGGSKARPAAKGAPDKRSTGPGGKPAGEGKLAGPGGRMRPAGSGDKGKPAAPGGTSTAAGLRSEGRPRSAPPRGKGGTRPR